MRARHAVSEHAQAHGVDPADVALAVTEAVSNAVRHAYPRERRGPIEVRAEPDGSDLVVSVSDSGIGLVADSPASGVGLGLPVIRKVADSVEIETHPGWGTRLRMRFRRSGKRD